MKVSSNVLSMNALKEFVDSCLFIHDDVEPDLRNENGDFIYDQFGSNPFFLGAQSCVVDTLDGFGEQYLGYLDEINCLPKNLIIPKRQVDSLLVNLLEDSNALDQARNIISDGRLNLSGFYVDETKDFNKLIELTSTAAHIPKLYPSQASYSVANNKVIAWQMMDKKGVLKPEGRLCFSEEDLLDYAEFNLKKNQSILLKKHHWQNHFVDNESALAKSLKKLSYPVIAERLYATNLSIVSHYIKINGNIYPLFILRQNIKNWKHYGNDLPAQLPRDVVEKIHRISGEIIELFPDFEGVFAVDYIVTDQNELLPVDLNPRFNTSTYPAYFLSRFNIPLNEVYAAMRFSYVPVVNLSSIFLDKKFVPFSPQRGEGVLLMTPVHDFSQKIIDSFFYLVIAKTPEKVLEYENLIEEITQRCKIAVNKNL